MNFQTEPTGYKKTILSDLQGAWNVFRQTTVGVVILVLVFCLSPGYAADKLDETYCHDKKSWAEWDELIRKYPEDTSLQMLHALRIGFCKKMDIAGTN